MFKKRDNIKEVEEGKYLEPKYLIKMALFL